MLAPATPEELAHALHRAALHNRSITLAGNGSKRRMAGAIQPADETISTAGLRGIRQYEPRDLTISVEAGLPWRELAGALAANRQMVPLDPPFGEDASVGGVIACNSSGPRRRLFGTARDLVIGMQFATIEGKVVQSGGMVVKNVAGLDMGKLMIGSFGTLAAITVVNFKVIPVPAEDRSFLLAFPSCAAAIEARNQILRGPLQPAALDLFNPAAGASLGKRAWLLAVRASGSTASVGRTEREMAGMGEAMAFEGPGQEALWARVREFTPLFLDGHPAGAVARVSCTLKELEAVAGSLEGPAAARAGSGVCYGYFAETRAAVEWIAGAAGRGWKAVIEFAPEDRRSLEMWPSHGNDLELMLRVKKLFDPLNLLNRGRLYNRI